LAISSEVDIARSKFPSTNHLLAALMEEVGELSKALLEGEPPEHVLHEAIQVATVAVRIAEEGSLGFSYYPQGYHRERVTEALRYLCCRPIPRVAPDAHEEGEAAVGSESGAAT